MRPPLFPRLYKTPLQSLLYASLFQILNYPQSLKMKSFLLFLQAGLFLVLNAQAQRYEGAHIRVRRGNYGERYSGGIGPSSAAGVGYGGTSSYGPHSGGGGGGPPFDHITMKAVSGGNDRFIQSYQATQNAGASSAGALDHLQQQGQHSAAAAGQAANNVGNWYNTIATGHVPPGYKGEHRRRRQAEWN